MVKEILPDIWTWSWYSSEKGYKFNGLALADEKDRILIDPVRFGNDQDRQAVENLGPFTAVYLTNKDHERIAYDLRREWKVPVWIHEADQDLLKEKADHVFHDDDELACGIRVIHLENQKSPGESAFYIESKKLLILGDALIGHPPGHLNLLPAMKYKDPAKAKESLKRLTGYQADSLLVGDGINVLNGPAKALNEFFN